MHKIIKLQTKCSQTVDSLHALSVRIKLKVTTENGVKPEINTGFFGSDCVQCLLNTDAHYTNAHTQFYPFLHH